MYARIVDGVVAQVVVDMPVLGAGECAHIARVADDVEVGWLWTADGCVAPPSAPEPDPNAGIDAQILALEATVTQRRMREAALTDEGKAWLADVDARITALRAQRTQE
jgi:hypothetical protein